VDSFNSPRNALKPSFQRSKSATAIPLISKVNVK
jgi:hypothetical protein